MDNASKFSCDILYNPQDTRYLENIRMFQGCPTIAVTKGGRIYLGWYSGGTREPHMNNYNILIYSDDNGITWSEPLLIIPSNYKKNIHALDIQLFIDPQGFLHVLWVQNNVMPIPQDKPSVQPGQPINFVDGYMFNDFRHAEWEIVCEEPDAETPLFSKPRFVFQGFLRCKPTFLKNGDWLCFAYDQLNNRYGYSISSDNGKTYTHYYGAQKKATYFDEAMAYELSDGRIRMFARTNLGELSESYSNDGARTWTEANLSGITASDTRFYVSKLPSGRIMLINNDDPKSRSKMTVQLSEDDGKTWKYRKCIDARRDLSYPDAGFNNGKIYLTYDRGRTSEREILFAVFSEQDIVNDNEITVSVISKPDALPSKNEVIERICEYKIIAILRNIPFEKLLPLAEALYDGGIRLLEITYNADGSMSDKETAKSIKILSKHFQNKMYIGAGTVLSDEQVRLARNSGGLFIVSPNVDPEIAREAHLCGMAYIPGTLTPTEIQYARKIDADFVSIFPAANFGLEYIKENKKPLSNIKILAFGVNENNISNYINAGICGFGIGSNIAPQKLVEEENYAAITNIAQNYVSAVKMAYYITIDSGTTNTKNQFS